MEICNACGHQYLPPVNVPVPVPDYMCAHCGTQMTKQEVENLPRPYNPNGQVPNQP